MEADVFEDMSELLEAWRHRRVELNKLARGIADPSSDEHADRTGEIKAYDGALRLYTELIVQQGKDEFEFPLFLAITIGEVLALYRGKGDAQQRRQLDACYREMKKAYWEALATTWRQTGPG